MVFFDITWGETFVLTGLAFALIGKKDLPKASRFLGAQLGRVVGFLQGVRVRADRFSEQHELRALHNELRSGLRELDAVRMELATAASSRGLVGRGLQSPPHATISPSLQQQGLNHPLDVHHSNPGQFEDHVLSQLAPRSQSVAAVAEAEWKKQGIGFVSKAEMGTAFNYSLYENNDQGIGGSAQKGKTGSMLLADLLQESLIFDQYDRTVREQDTLLQKNAETLLLKHNQNVQNETRVELIKKDPQ